MARRRRGMCTSFGSTCRSTSAKSPPRNHKGAFGYVVRSQIAARGILMITERRASHHREVGRLIFLSPNNATLREPAKGVPGDPYGFFDVRGAMRRRDKARLDRRSRQIDAGIQHRMKET